MNIYIGGDHAGYELKEKLKPFIEKLGYQVKDLGPFSYEEKDDYPDFCAPVAKAVAEDNESMGIVIGGSSVGESIVANRFHKVRAFGYYGGPMDVVKLSREHNDANVLSLGARLVNTEEAMFAVKVWLTTKFSGDERHVRRIAKLDKLG